MAFIRATYHDDAERMRPVSTLNRHANAAALAEFTERVVAQRPEWQAEGLCAGMDLAVFFPRRGRKDNGAEARAVCEGCPVKAQCLEMGLQEKHGVWGGTSEKERRRIRRQRLAQAEAS